MDERIDQRGPAAPSKRPAKVAIWLEIEDPEGRLDESTLAALAGPPMLTVAQMISGGHPHGRTMVYLDDGRWLWVSFIRGQARPLAAASDPAPEEDPPDAA